MPPSCLVRRLTGSALPVSARPASHAWAGVLVAAAIALAASPASAQSQTSLWRSAVRAAGGDATASGTGAEAAWERTLRAGPALADERFGWRHTWHDTGRYALWTGVGGALRESRQAFSIARTYDPAAGLAPMLSAGGEWRITPGWRLMAELDGVGGPRGRMLDFGARVQWDLSPQWTLGAGWRVLDTTVDSPRGGGYGRWSGAAFSAGWRF